MKQISQSKNCKDVYVLRNVMYVDCQVEKKECRGIIVIYLMSPH